MYRSVAERLSAIARNEQSDPFGRSSFNRSYYSLFLVARELIFKFDSNKVAIDHASLPKMLRGQVSKSIKDESVKLEKLGFRELNGVKSETLEALDALAQLLDDARQLRTIADYHPEQRISFEGGAITLGNKKDTEAIGWIRKAEFLCGRIENGLRKFKII